ncbi:MAG: aldehyde ferredoxin oxidoreductase family protein [Deltaproteobacteria bacterium]|uniref:aldehyde ferredoxin oxidoreductase family protein n=1 Tax=Desulfobacula sp. TaxID=2593537 RepID=UPI001994A639|nr:aldehyde ferredoxin oxidoreductase family protein [Candidatus Desulfobacula maris]MBL6994290.1 aldehyde ferredoxin oxidoreductase family protein [Desulfobacula sp.]
MHKGFMGKYLVVDLTDGTIETVELSENFYKKYLTGYGMGAAVIAERQKPGIDAMAPESHLGLCSGLLTGSDLPFTGRFMAVAKSPLTGGWGDANGGGYLSREIKRTGYDAVFFTGRAVQPTWVHITDEGVEIKDASSLWGKDISETETAIKTELGTKKVQIASIGMSGEKLSLISGIATDKSRIAARSGLGAVMGSKNLKAVSFLGSNEITVARPDEVKALAKQFLAEYKKNANIADKLSVRFINFLSKLVAKAGFNPPATNGNVKLIFRTWGTPGLTMFSGLTGDTPVKNWGGSSVADFPFDRVEKLSGETVIKRQKRRYACQACPLGCGGMVDVKTGQYQGSEGHKPEYETIAAFGSLLLNDDLDSIIEINEMCNRAGIDTISAGSTVAYAIECFENGIIDEKTTGGLKLGWGNVEEIIKLIEIIISRKGFGDILADGVKAATKKIGWESERFAIHAGGQELPMHDSRNDPGWALTYQCEPTPGRHTIASYVDSDLRSGKEQFPEIKRMLKKAKTQKAKKVSLNTATIIYSQLINGSGVCIFGPDTAKYPMVDFLNAVTGWDLTPDEYFKTGKRILNLRKAFNVREGIRPSDSKLPPRAIGKPPLTQGPLKDVSVDIEILEKELYIIMGWDRDTGGPTAETLKEMELDDLFNQ